jgi:hypothetical protein
MKRALAAALLACAALPAHAWTRIGINIGVPLYWPAPYYYYPPPVYYPPVVVQQPPTVYVQPAPPAEAFWYYCPDSRTYYPYVASCASAWQRVSPVPEDQRPPR